MDKWHIYLSLGLFGFESFGLDASLFVNTSTNVFKLPAQCFNCWQVFVVQFMHTSYIFSCDHSVFDLFQVFFY